MWLLDGRVYHYPKEGSVEVASMEEADRRIQHQREVGGDWKGE